MQAVRVSIRPTVRLRRPHSLSHRNHHLDRRVDLELFMPLLFLRNGDSRVGNIVDQSSILHHEMVYRTDSLLDLHEYEIRTVLFCIILPFKVIHLIYLFIISWCFMLLFR